MQGYAGRFGPISRFSDADPAVQAEILAATAALADDHLEPGLHECDDNIRKFIAATWLQVFNGAP